MDEINFESLKITDTDENGKSVLISDSADRPNAFNSYQNSKKNSYDVKAMFDAPFLLVKKKFNDLVDKIKLLVQHQNDAIEEQNKKVRTVYDAYERGDLKGDTGDQGIQGEQGIQGIQGEKGDAGVVEFIVVNELPSENIKNAIYLLHSADTESGNVFDEYIYVNDAWEKIGNASVAINLEDYAKKEYVDDVIGDIAAALDELHAYAEDLKGGEA